MKQWCVFLMLAAALPLCAQKQSPAALVNINAATVEELEVLPAIGKARAEMIVRVRERNGPFKRIEELRALPRLSEGQFQELRKYVTIGPGTEPKSKDSKDSP